MKCSCQNETSIVKVTTRNATVVLDVINTVMQLNFSVQSGKVKVLRYYHNMSQTRPVRRSRDGA